LSRDERRGFRDYHAPGRLNATGAASVTTHEQVEHINSSTLDTVIQLLQAARAKKIKTDIFYDSSLKWQKVNFDVLRLFCDGELLHLRS